MNRRRRFDTLASARRPNRLNIIKRRLNDVTILDVQGVIKLGESAREFSRYLDKVLTDETGAVIINFEQINYMDSTGLGELIGYLQRFEERRRPMVLVKPSHRIKALLELTKLGQIFDIFESEEEAVEHLRPN
ncbi:MAG TPA: STAS domain-containing protein [Thermoanaerobaculia bacterium]|nr:STAS domain-containing protein [Thermoanaerobaculia bacterium]